MLNKVMQWFGYEKRLIGKANFHPATFGGTTHSGVGVTPDTALTLSSVFCAVRVISEAVASLPLILYRRLPQGGKDRATEHPVFDLLANPNPEQTAFVFRETLQSHVLLHGNFFAEVERDGAGRPVALWPLPPHKVKVQRDDAGHLVYAIVTNPADPVYLLPENILHVPGLGFDGCVGYSPVALARESLGLTMATERFGASFFGNASRPSGVLEHPGALTDQARDNVRKSWEALHRGTGNTGNVAILEEGMKWAATSVPPEDGQFLQSRAFQITEISRWFNLSPVFLHDLSQGASWQSLESLNTSFYQATIRPWLIRIEQEYAKKLLSAEERSTYFAEHLIDAILRGDTQSRYQAYQTGFMNGWLDLDTILGKENMNPLPGGLGKLHFVPQNLIPIELLVEKLKAEANPPPAPVDTAPGGQGNDGSTIDTGAGEGAGPEN